MKLFSHSFLIALGVLLSTPAAFAADVPEVVIPEETPVESAEPATDCNQQSKLTNAIATETMVASTWELGSTQPLLPFKSDGNAIVTIDGVAEETDDLPLLTIDDLNRQTLLAEGDRLYRCGDKAEAERLYRQAKTPFAAEVSIERSQIAEPIREPGQLQPGGAAYWRMYQQGLADEKFESKILVPLELLVEQYPEFIPGHLQYAQALEKAGKHEQATQILQHATALYPNEADLAKAQIESYQTSEDWLEASIGARQFVAFNPEHPQAAEFTRIADENLERYKDDLESDVTWNAVGNAIVGGVGFALTGNIFGPISAVETTVLLLEGESSIGDRYAKDVREELPMMEDEEVLAYVRGIGNELAAVAGRDEFNYEFYIIMDDRLNAFALPGGKIFINAGAILATQSEAELAGLLAHELSHAVLSHGFQLMAQGSLTTNVTQYIPYVGGMAGDLIVLDYSRDMEQQADLFGTRLLAASGYAADGVRNLMITLNNQEDPGIPAWLSTHPDNEDRVNYMEAAIVRQRLNRYGYEGFDRHQAIKRRVANLMGEHREQEGR